MKLIVLKDKEDQEDQLKNKGSLKKKNISPLMFLGRKTQPPGLINIKNLKHLEVVQVPLHNIMLFIEF